MKTQGPALHEKHATRTGFATFNSCYKTLAAGRQAGLQVHLEKTFIFERMC